MTSLEKLRQSSYFCTDAADLFLRSDWGLVFNHQSRLLCCKSGHAYKASWVEDQMEQRPVQVESLAPLEPPPLFHSHYVYCEGDSNDKYV